MSEMSRGNGPTGAPAEGLQQLIVNAQYIKDLSFENPRAPQSLMQQNAPPEVDIHVDVQARTLSQDVFEVVLTITANAKMAGDPIFIVELAYGAVVTVKNVPELAVRELVLVETPRTIFPFARAVIANATRDGGFPPLLINPIDFAELIRREGVAATGGTATA